MDFINDEIVKGFGVLVCVKMCWDVKFKKYVLCDNDEDGFKGVCLIIGEFGVKIVVFF